MNAIDIVYLLLKNTKSYIYFARKSKYSQLNHKVIV